MIPSKGQNHNIQKTSSIKSVPLTPVPTFDSLNINTVEGKLLLVAVAKIWENEGTKTPDQVVKNLDTTQKKVFKNNNPYGY